jgi:peptide/nickel transport system substrate-binding protein
MNSCLPALLLIVSLTIVGCGGEKSSSAHSNTLVFSRGSDAQKLDPADVDDGESVKTLNQICEGLLRFKPGTLELEPWLAESYSLSDDGLKITFKIREGIIFHDGTPVTAEAAAFSFLRQMDKEHPGHLPGAIFQYWTSLYSDIETVTVEGPMTLTMGLRQPNATILFSLAAFPAYLISPQSLVDYGQDMVRNPVGTGPYQFSSWEPNQAIILKKFDNYWGEPAGFERLVIKSVPENAVRLLDLKAGKTQILDGLQPAEVQPLIEDPNFDVYHEPGMNFCYLAINETAERLREPEIREALYMAIDREKLVRVALDGLGQVAHFPMAKGMLGEPAEFDPVPFDPDTARAVLAKYADRWTEPISISVMNAARLYAPDPVNLISLIREDLKQVGITIQVDVRDFKNHLHHTRNGRHEIGFLGWMGDNGDPDNFLSIHLASWAANLGGATNIAFYKNSEMDRLLIEGRKASVLNDRRLIYEKALAIWRHDLPILPLLHGESIVVLRSDLKGFTLSKTGDVYLGPVKPSTGRALD